MTLNQKRLRNKDKTDSSSVSSRSSAGNSTLERDPNWNSRSNRGSIENTNENHKASGKKANQRSSRPPIEKT